MDRHVPAESVSIFNPRRAAPLITGSSGAVTLQPSDIFCGLDTYGWPEQELFTWAPQQRYSPLITGPMGPTFSPVPNVVGSTHYAQILTAAGFAYLITNFAPSSMVVPGAVISQMPTSGTPEPGGYTIQLVVANPPVLVGDPNYIINALPRLFSISVLPRTFTVNWTNGSAMQLFDIKDPAESVNLTFNYLPGLSSGETLTGVPTVDITTLSGSDPSPLLVLNGTAGFDSTNSKIVQPVTAGVDGCEYEFVTFCATSAGRTLALVGGLPVRR